MLSNYSLILSGSQGTGKSTLATAWAEYAGVHFRAVQTRHFMPDGITNHLGILRLAVEDPASAVGFQTKLITNRAALFEDCHKRGESIVSDRAVFDSYAYFLLHNSMFASDEENERNRKITTESILSYDITVFMNTSLDTVENNGIRTSNPEYSMAVTSTLLRVIMRSYDHLYGNTLSNNAVIQHPTENAFVSLKFNHQGKGVVILNEPQGMVPTEARLQLLESAVSFINSVRVK